MFRIRTSFLADLDPRSQKCPYGSGSGSRPLIFYSDVDLDPDPRGVKIKLDNLYHQIFNNIFQNDIKTPLKISKHKVLQKVLAFLFPVLYFPNEPEHFLGFIISWIRIWICPCGSGWGSRRHIFMRIHVDPDPKHC